ncbi:MAG TPA: signal peptide peptidase SppA [bacterium]|nr:signal peptide peptidase SppA [bacterium]
MKRSKRWILLLVLLSIIGVIVIIGSERLATEKAVITPNSVFILDLRESYPEVVTTGIAELMGEPRLSFRQLVTSVRRAAEEPNVRACLLNTGMGGLGWAQTEELRDALVYFKSTGKPVIAYLETAQTRDYYLASVATEVYMAHEGFLHLSLLAEVPFMNRALGKLRIEPDFIWEGKYKSSPEMFLRDSMSEPHREEMNSLLDSIKYTMMQSVADVRGISPEIFQSALDETFLTAKRAKELRLVDQLLYPDEVTQSIKTQLEVTEIGKSYPADYGFTDGLLAKISNRPKVAVVYAVGVIQAGSSQQGGIFGDILGSDTLWRQLEDLRKDSAVRAVVLRIDSPGGSGLASDIIWRGVTRLREKKPVIVSMGDMAASGGYYIAMGADHIIAEPNTLTGSIGVFAGKFNMKGFYDWLGLTFEQLKGGQQADIFSDNSNFSPEQRAIIQSSLSDFYKTFVAKAAQGRKKEFEQIHAVAQGRVWSGIQALDAGLVDQLGGLDTAIDVARERAGIVGDIQLVIYPKKKGILSFFRKGEGKFELQMPEQIQTLMRYEALARMFERDRVLALVPEFIKQ